MNAELRGNTEFQTVQQQVSRLWELYNGAWAQSSGVKGFRARIDARTQELLRRVNTVAATTLISHRVSVTRTVTSLEEALRIIEQGHTNEIIAIALHIAADPAIDDASANLRDAGAAKLNANVLLMIVLVLITLALSIGQAELPGKVQAIAPWIGPQI